MARVASGTDLFGAPYDWRFAPDTLREQGYFDALKGLVEGAFAKSNGTRVTIITHSMVRPPLVHHHRGSCSWGLTRRRVTGDGATEAASQAPSIAHMMGGVWGWQGGPVALDFLNHMDASWKDQFLHAYVPISGPFAGAMSSLQAMISGVFLSHARCGCGTGTMTPLLMAGFVLMV
jgi:hypothetical protein